MSVAEIAKHLCIRYQHAYNVLKRSNFLKEVAAPPPARSDRSPATNPNSKPPLHVKDLVDRGFSLATSWTLSEDGLLQLRNKLPKQVGVYAFAKADTVLYIGVATMGLNRRLYFYGKPGKTQRTSQRLNSIIRTELASFPTIDIYVAFPPDHDWNGLPIHGSAGLELGLIKKYHLPWNMRSAK